MSRSTPKACTPAKNVLLTLRARSLGASSVLELALDIKHRAPIDKNMSQKILDHCTSSVEAMSGWSTQSMHSSY